MTRVCLIGNSHLAALKNASARSPQTAENIGDWVYWGAAGTDFPKIVLKNDELHSPKPDFAYMISNQRYRSLPLSNFDVAVFYACHMDLTPPVRTIANSLSGHYSLDFKIDAIRSYAQSWLKSLSLSSLLECVRGRFPDLKAIVCAHPMNASPRLQTFRNLETSRFALGLFQEVIEESYNELAVSYLRQPSETLDKEGLTTKTIYSKGSTRLHADNIPHPDADYGHMNADYGEIQLIKLASVIAPD